MPVRGLGGGLDGGSLEGGMAMPGQRLQANSTPGCTLIDPDKFESCLILLIVKS